MKTAPRIRRRRIWLWLLAAIVAPWVIIAACVWSVLTPTRALVTLHQSLMANAGDNDWRTRVQFDVGPGTLALAGVGLRFVPHEDIDLARTAIAAVRRASVGVYERPAKDERAGMMQSVAAMENVMQRHGWEPVVKVIDSGQHVLVFHDRAATRGGEFCLVVLEPEQCVLVHADLRADELAQLVALARRDRLPGLPL